MAGDAPIKARPSRSRGRPRTEGLDERVLAAARAIVDRDGYAAATIDLIAAAAGASKSSIYRRWPSKGVLVYDACLAHADELVRVIDTGDIRADLTAIAMITARATRSKSQSGLFSQILADAERDPELMAQLRRRFFAPRSDAIIARVEAAIERGELRGDFNVALVPALLNGPHRYMRAVRARGLSDAEVRDLVDLIIGHRIVDRSC
jgi:AcrR family transcriptional regulator